MWSQTSTKYDRSALWESPLGERSDDSSKAFATQGNQLGTSYSKRRIIAVTKVEIANGHDYNILIGLQYEGNDDALIQTLTLHTPTQEDSFTRIKTKKNRLMRIDELHKFSDGTLDDVRTVLNDRLKGIRMEYLPETFWSQRDKANARAMIQAIDKRLKTRRIMRSLEKLSWTTLTG
ncbi:hypothetical protein Tco_1514926 [Tanacetum coccineum]